VELAGALAELARFALARDFRNIDTTQTRIVLIEAGERILPTFPQTLSAWCRRSIGARCSAWRR
jgi:NADH:ubiquinone reductase (H+-translocating)